MLKRIFHYKPSPLKMLVLIVVIPPLALIIMSFITAMVWRVVAGTDMYKIGYIVSGLLSLSILITFLMLLRFAWNAMNHKHLWSRFLSVAASIILLFANITLPDNFPPLKRLLDDFYGKVYYLGEVSPESFVKLKNKVDSAIFPPTKIIIGSGGGDAYAGLAIGYLIYEHQLDVEVLGLCASSCANYLFPAGRKKVLNKHAIVMYHGNSLQESFVNFIEELEKVNGDMSKLPKDIDFGKKDKEVSITLAKSDGSEANNPNSPRQAVFNYLGWRDLTTDLDVYKRFIEEEKQFYKKLGVDHKIGIYGQIGDYEGIYQGYQYNGFYYSIDDMHKMGVKHIHVQDGPWQPELNPVSENVYKVSLKN